MKASKFRRQRDAALAEVAELRQKLEPDFVEEDLSELKVVVKAAELVKGARATAKGTASKGLVESLAAVLPERVLQ